MRHVPWTMLISPCPCRLLSHDRWAITHIWCAANARWTLDPPSARSSQALDPGPRSVALPITGRLPATEWRIDLGSWSLAVEFGFYLFQLNGCAQRRKETRQTFIAPQFTTEQLRTTNTLRPSLIKLRPWSPSHSRGLHAATAEDVADAAIRARTASPSGLRRSTRPAIAPERAASAASR